MLAKRGGRPREVVAQERWSLKRGGRSREAVAQERQSLKRGGRSREMVAQERWSLKRDGRSREMVAFRREVLLSTSPTNIIRKDFVKITIILCCYFTGDPIVVYFV
jgi:hypothetical protein